MEPATHAPTRAAKLKEHANAKFKAGKMLRARDLYTEAIEASTATDAGTLHLLYSNRALVHLTLFSFPEAAQDALKCVTLKPGFAKGHVRCAQAARAMGHFGDCASM